MKVRKLGHSDLNISTVSMGCWAFGGGDLWGEQDEADIERRVRAAMDCGINLFDTAEAYGENGLSETRLGKALGQHRSEVIIATKISSDLTREGVMNHCEGSLKRLGTDTIDLYQIHWPRHEVPLDGTIGALKKLLAQGKIRAIGVSNFGPKDTDDLVELGGAASNQLLYSMLARMIEDEVVPRCLEHEIGILCYSPLAQGLLTGKWASPVDVPEVRARNRFFSSDRPGTLHNETGCEGEVFEALGRFRSICERLGEPMAVVALAWCLHQPGITSVLVGAQSAEQILLNVRAADLELDTQTIAELTEASEPVKARLVPNLDILLEAARTRYR